MERHLDEPALLLIVAGASRSKTPLCDGQAVDRVHINVQVRRGGALGFWHGLGAGFPLEDQRVVRNGVSVVVSSFFFSRCTRQQTDDTHFYFIFILVSATGNIFGSMWPSRPWGTGTALPDNGRWQGFRRRCPSGKSSAVDVGPSRLRELGASLGRACSAHHRCIA